jgi:hypothetical protein
VSGAAQALQGAINLLTSFYESPSLAHSRALVLIDKELPVLREALDDVEWTEKGLAEWRDVAQANARQAEAARATARVAIGHLQSVLNKPRSHAEQQAADTVARDWLISIGSEPT